MSDDCRCVLFEVTAWCDAATALVRPTEVAPLLTTGNVAADTTAVLATVLYRHDPPDCDQWCAPSATLASRAGDCDDKAVLGASLLRAGGWQAWVVIGAYDPHGRPGTEANHAWVEGRDPAEQFVHLESVTGHFTYGGRPPEYRPIQVLDPTNCHAAAAEELAVPTAEGGETLTVGGTPITTGMIVGGVVAAAGVALVLSALTDRSTPRRRD